MASWWRSRAVVLGAALLALVAVVALATRAHAPAGGGGGATRQIDSDVLLQYAALVVLLLAAVGLPLVAWSLWGARGEGHSVPNRGNWMRRSLITTAVLAAVSVAFLTYRAHNRGNGGKATPVASPPARIESPDEPKPRPDGFDWVIPVVVLAVGLGGAALAVVLLARAERPRPRRDHELAAAALFDALDESLEDLRAERDARRAVIAAYARMERALGAAGVPRRPSEAPLEYLARVLSDLLQASAASVTRLTALFERAQFSLHEIGPQLKEEAIEALVAVRDELRAAST